MFSGSPVLAWEKVRTTLGHTHGVLFSATKLDRVRLFHCGHKEQEGLIYTGPCAMKLLRAAKLLPAGPRLEMMKDGAGTKAAQAEGQGSRNLSSKLHGATCEALGFLSS